MPSQWVSSWWAWRRLLPLAVIVVGGLLLLLLATREPTPAAVLADLATDTGFRPVEMRLSLPTPYAPFRLTAERKKESIGSSLFSDVAKIALPAEPGLTHLLLGDWERAVVQLERTGAPNDLAAAYYMRGIATDSLLDFCRATDALADAGDSAETLFNRALILEQLADDEGAAAMWSAYLEKDPDSAWAGEARKHRDRTMLPSVAVTWRRDKPRLLEAARAGKEESVRAFAARYPLAVRQVVELELLPSWGATLARGETHIAVETLDKARLIVKHRRVSEERLLEDAIAEISDAIGLGREAGLARAYSCLGNGVTALNESKHAEALTAFSEALTFAGPEAPAFKALVLPNAITAHYRRYEYPEVEALIETTRDLYGGRRAQYAALFARLDWLAGLVHIARPDASQAIRSYQSALQGYERLGETEYQAAQHINLADSYVNLGDRERTAVHVRKALNLASRAEDLQRLHGILKVAARLALESSGPGAAVVFQDRLVRMARREKDPMRLPDALVSRSAVLGRAGRSVEAVRDLTEMRTLVPRVEDAPTRQRLEADAGVAEALAYRDRDDRRVLEALSGAIDRFRQLNMRASLERLLLERGRTHLRLGDASAAERDFRTGIDLLESQRERVTEEHLRIALFDRADLVFVELASLVLGRGQVADAFDLLERFRSRELLDRTAGRSARPLGLTAIRARIPPNTVLVTHTLHTKGLMTFAVTQDSVRAFSSTVDRTELEELIRKLSTSFDSARPLPNDALHRLGELLTDGLNAPSGSALIFVPDESLSRVPFSALMANGHYLIESHPISVAPSATLLVLPERSPVSPTTSARPQSVLVVASREAPIGYAELQPLPQTFAEATRVASTYARSRMVTATDADAATMLDQAADYDILHFAGHSVVDRRMPARSALLLGARGKVTAPQIEARDLSRLELVVLGGCNTGLGRTHRSEGVFSLARAFLVAGVPSVLSTIAPIEDSAAEQVLTEFHRQYAGGLDAPRALREAQLKMLRSLDPRHADPASWSSFHIIGGGLEKRR